MFLNCEITVHESQQSARVYQVDADDDQLPLAKCEEVIYGNYVLRTHGYERSLNSPSSKICPKGGSAVRT